MKKRTIKKTYFYVKENYLMNIFGLDGRNKPLIITENNFENLKSYVEEVYLNPDILAFLPQIKEELKHVDEVQFIME